MGCMFRQATDVSASLAKASNAHTHNRDTAMHAYAHKERLQVSPTFLADMVLYFIIWVCSNPHWTWSLSPPPPALPAPVCNARAHSFWTRVRQERAKYQHDTDKNMSFVKFTKTAGDSGDAGATAAGTPIGVFNWYAVHGTSLNNTNALVAGDNKGQWKDRTPFATPRTALGRVDRRSVLAVDASG